MNEKALLFSKINEPYAEGFFECPQRSNFFRFSLASRRYFEKCTLPKYDGGHLYPSGKVTNDKFAVFPSYSFTFSINHKLLKEKSEICESYATEEMELVKGLETPHTVGGNCYTHSFPNYKRIIKEGLNSYKTRIDALEACDFKDGLLEVLQGIEAYHSRSVKILKEMNAPLRLINALSNVPFLPAQNLYEAIVAWNFIYYIDGCDNPGRLDADLIEYYNGEDATEIFIEFFKNIDNNDGWSAALGPDCNQLTLQILKAIKGIRRPNIELRVTESTPEDIWSASIDAIMSGCGQPAFYNETLYQSTLANLFPDIPKEDLLKFNGGGCTETMLAGISRVGSLDAGINLALIFSDHMRNNLKKSTDFNVFCDTLIEKIKVTVSDVLDMVNEYYRKRAEYIPQPIRTLFIDDCIDKGLDFNAGGARYNWSIINFAGLINVIDSILAIKKLVYDDKTYENEEFIKLLNMEDSEFYNELRNCPCFGVDDEYADAFATDFATKIFDTLKQKIPYLGGKFLAASIQFITYDTAGKNILSTPDGRKNFEPLCDSIGAVHGKDINGPTALLNSVAKLPLTKAIGTPVLNFRLQKKNIPNTLRPLVLGFFKQGGLQMQVSCISKEDLEDALIHPEKHGNLIVRIGGYSEYFYRLSTDLKKAVIERTEHGT